MPNQTDKMKAVSSSPRHTTPQVPSPLTARKNQAIKAPPVYSPQPTPKVLQTKLRLPIHRNVSAAGSEVHLRPEAVKAKDQFRVFQPNGFSALNPVVQLATARRRNRGGGGGGKKSKGGGKSTTAKKQSKAARSFNNLCAYRSGWVKRNDITLETVTAFIKTHPEGIRGHASGDNSQGEQDNTTLDCLAYKSWHTGLYGWRG